MRLRSILSAAVAIAVSSSLQGADAAEASKRLSASDFADHIADGATFVKYYSPECKHSQALGMMKMEPGKSQVIAQSIHVPLIFKHFFYKGKPVTKYTKKRSIEALRDFVSAMAAEYINVPPGISIEEVGEVRANALGKVVALDLESYDRRTQFGPWMIEYYAPWCGHCKALAPVYEELAEVLKGKINVGKVDCTRNEDICRKQKVRGYPTIKLHQYGQSIEHTKQRSLEAMTEFALGAIVPSVKPVTLEEITNIKDRNDVTFVYIHDAQTDPKITALIEKQSQIYYEQVTLHSSDDSELARRLSVSSPALVVLKNNRQYQYQGSLTDSVAVQSWISEAKTPLVITLSGHNTGTVLSQPGWLVLGLFDPSKPATLAARRELIESAHKYYETLEGRTLLGDKPLRFAIMDGTKWENYLRGAFNLALSDLPVVLVISSREELFYPFGLDGRRAPVNQEGLLTYFADIESGLLVPKSMVSTPQKIFRQLQRRFQVVTNFSNEHPMIAMLIGSAFLLALMRVIGGKPIEKEEEKEKQD
ncbi:hypothetical protein BGX34_004236 [Mortierella sp. NVP85]|nr:hypothetical protein BGX34_004236 [Mortierella sp. NVP85]